MVKYHHPLIVASELQQRVPQRRQRPVVVARKEVGSTTNNSDKPHIMSRYDRQRTMRLNRKEYYIRTFFEEAIKNHRVVIFGKNKTDPICKKVEVLFTTNVDTTKLKTEMIVYHLDELPYQGGEKLQNYLTKNYDSSTTEHCYVFIRGTHVPLARLERILVGNNKSTRLSSAAAATKTSVRRQPSSSFAADDIHCSTSVSNNNSHICHDNSSWFYPDTD